MKKMANNPDTKKKPVIAHCIEPYLPLTEVWLYQYVNNHRMVKPIVLTNWTENLDQFPFKPIYALENCPSKPMKRFTWRWFCHRLEERVLGMNPHRLRSRERSFYKEAIKGDKVKLLHAHFGPVGVRMLPLKRKLGLPLITTFYGYDMSRLAKRKSWRERYRKLFSEGELFLVEGEYMQEELVKLGCPREKVKIQRIAIDLDKYEFVPRSLHTLDSDIEVLFCGSFREKKGIPYAIEAFSIACRRHLNLKLRLVGDGHLRPSIEGLIGQLGLEKRVSLLGYLPHADYIEELKNAHILMAPSVTADDGDSEGGAPTVLLEAQATGMPVLSTYHADIPNIVLEGKTGFLVPERDAEALAEKLLYLIQHHEDWEKIGEAGRRHIEAKHNIHLEIDTLESRFLNLLEL